MPRSEAQKKADKKYKEKTYRNIQAAVKKAEYEMIDAYCKKTGISKARLIVEGCKMYMQAHGDEQVHNEEEDN